MINLYNLKYFTDSARLGSMTKAAELNNLSRPAISIAIQKLEEEMGAKLLVHKRRSLELTQTGITLLSKSQELLSQVEELKSQISSAKGPLVGDFKIGSSRTLATFNLPQIMARLRAKHPAINLKIQLANSEDLMLKLSNREIDMAFFIGDESLADFKSTVLSRGHYCLIKPKNLKDSEAQYAITERRPETERLKTVFEKTFSKKLPVFSEIQSWDAIYTWVNHGICGGLVPDFMLESKASTAKNLSVVLHKVFPYEIKAMFPKSKSENTIIKSFLECMNG